LENKKHLCDSASRELCAVVTCPRVRSSTSDGDKNPPTLLTVFIIPYSTPVNQTPFGTPFNQTLSPVNQTSFHQHL